MIISKSDLYKNGWLDLVFTGRNKNYGAYELRHSNSQTMTKAMLITFTTVTALMFGLSYAVRAKNTEAIHKVDVTIKTYVPPVPPKDEKIHEMKHPAAAHKQTTMTQFLVPKVTTEPVTVEPVKLNEIKGDVGPINVDVPDGLPDPGSISIDPGISGTGTATKDDNVIHDYVDIEPEPVGGAAAWNKFLQKNLHYPHEAVENQKSGKVYLSFVVEKDGHITDITVIRGQGYGMDEEAARVLKLAPLWKPGMQHSRPVRVKYTLPFNFQLDQ